MNEVTKIHLGRQAFTVSAAAHRQLRAYLDAIEKQVKDKDVLDEVELRMAELLMEHGVHGDKVVLPKDVDFLKKQLGNPKDFEDDTEASPATSGIEGKRLFRDTDNGMLAGVAAGLSLYFGIDVLLIRILFVVGTIAWGGGVLLYILLWLLVPEAKSPSDRLQMAGKAVTVESLKEVVERADVKGAAKRANKSLAGPVNSVFSVLIKLIGVGLTLLGLCFLLALLTGAGYLAAHGNVIMDNLFPIGFKEHLLIYVGAAVATFISLFLVLCGMAVYKRRWPVRTWITGVLVGLTLVGIAAGSALAGDTFPTVRDRYNAHFRTIVKNVQPFNSVNINGPATVDSRFSDKYYVTIRYYDQSNPSPINVRVNKGTLYIETQGYQSDRHCSSLCLPNHFDLDITVYSPDSQNHEPFTNIPILPGTPSFNNQ